MVHDEPAAAADAETAEREESSRWPAIIIRLLAWSIFGVVFGGLPLIADGFIDAFGPARMA